MSTKLWDRLTRRAIPALTLTVAGAGILIGSAGAQAPPAPHWGPYQWNGGAERADVRAFWIFDRTGDQQMNDIIRVVANAWNDARAEHPELPFIGIVEDDANAGACFVNRTPGFSIASACLIPENIEDVRVIAARNPDQQGHLIGAAFAVSDGLTTNEAFTAVCHGLGHVMGLENSTDPESCMSHDFEAGTFKWYTEEDSEAILDLYAHDDTGGGTTTTSSSTTTSTSTTSTSTSTTTTTVATTTTSSSSSSTTSSSTTTSTLVDLPDITLPTTTTTTTGGSQ